ncbi:Uncaracterized surface protein containing fasciclin (FAS1) repeats [Salegentibacter holothuriorum]|uniref:Uncaracterized surface protein containing fasciclin (FAS1) repeats n=1 Tax=Salegentibacter holothuriorum TaxID=241145 RepID=A0A1T5DER5_9FLAO|nr:fasciclin domain-containing protein [Salegentibacter holothuriorum]SKB70192.1 Uncaracterized surface protein containing fasciclin (FAS1) repeats [Salegentibacter holothuriorum]
MKTFKFTKILLLAFLTFGLFSCSDDDDAGDVITPSNTIADFVAGNPDYSSLGAALEVTGLDATLDGTANFTVFAPNNAAFNSFLSANGFNSLSEVPEDVLTQILLNHVQEGEIMSNALTTGYIESMATGMASDEPLSMYINTDDGVTINGASSVTTADVEVDNGIIHAVDAVIGLPDVTTFATADPNFDILVQALTADASFTFVETLMMNEDPAPFTVFAPTNTAFANVLAELELAGLGDIPADLLSSILSYHVVVGANVRAEDLTDGMSVTTLETGSFTINLGENVTITDENGRTATIVATNVQANNGVIHALDTVILPENDAIEIETNTIADFVAGNDDYSSLLAALEATSLTGTFTGTDNYTVFAPNNDAFAAFLTDNGFNSLDEVPTDLLTQVLLNHVQMGEIMSTDLTTGYIPSMAVWGASAEPLSMYINTDDGVMINGVASVTAADIETDNGVIHAVDAVIGLPDVTTFAIADPNFDILVQALTREESFNFVETLMITEDPAPFTVFAPINDAFVALLDELELAALGDIPTETLEATLQYHVVTGANVRSGDLTDGMEVSTLQGEDFTVNLGDDVMITDGRGRTATVIAVDVQATNGVIHALDTVLLPPTD